MLSDEKPNKKTIEISQLKGGRGILPKATRTESISTDLKYDVIYTDLYNMHVTTQNRMRGRIRFNDDLKINNVIVGEIMCNINLHDSRHKTPGIYYNIRLRPRRTDLPEFSYVFSMHPTKFFSDGTFLSHRIHLHSKHNFDNVYYQGLNLSYDPTSDKIVFQDKKYNHKRNIVTINYIQNGVKISNIQGSLDIHGIRQIARDIGNFIYRECRGGPYHVDELANAVENDVENKLKNVKLYGEDLKQHFFKIIQTHIERARGFGSNSDRFLNQSGITKKRKAREEARRAEAERQAEEARRAEAERQAEEARRAEEARIAERRRDAEKRRKAEIRRRIVEAVTQARADERREAERRREVQRKEAEIQAQRREAEISRRIAEAVAQARADERREAERRREVQRKEAEIQAQRREAEISRRIAEAVAQARAEERREAERRRRIAEAVTQARANEGKLMENTLYDSGLKDSRGNKRKRTGGYSKKYLKYKNKYIQLKKKLLLSKK